MSNFKALDLSGQITKVLEKKGYLEPTPIQKQSIPHLLKGKDLLGIAQTGTGKTAAFALPIIDNLIKNKVKVRKNNIRALILTPTRELATQISYNIKIYSKGSYLNCLTLFGGVSINNQIKAMKDGCDIVVATPGRFLDLKNRGHIGFSQIEIFVLDEADRMLDMGFINDVRKITSFLPDNRQNLLFSATMPKDIEILAEDLLNDPIKVEVTAESTTVEKIDQKVKFISKSGKLKLLKSVINEGNNKKIILVFSQTKHGANKVARFLEEENISAGVIHGNKSQGARQKALNDFRQGKINILIATDIAARGIDIPTITHVINYDIPQDPASYVHRIGRTARAGRDGIAISFCSSVERDLLRSVEKTINYKIPVDEKYSLKDLEIDVKVKKENKPKSSKNSKKPDLKENLSYFAQGRRHSKSPYEGDSNPGSKKKKNFKKPTKKTFTKTASAKSKSANKFLGKKTSGKKFGAKKNSKKL